MRALQCEGDGRVTIADLPDPKPRDGEALIRIEASGLCGSERDSLRVGSSWPEGLVGNGGHEACGIVVEPGESRFQPGDRVGLSAIVGCNACVRCAAGQELFCRSGGPQGSSKSGGWHAELVTVDARALRELPAHVDALTGVLVSGDTLGVPARGLRRVPTSVGDRVLVIGLGPVGLAHAAVRTFAGCDVFGVEPSAYRRKLAASLGIDTVSSIDDVTDFRARLVIECSGQPSCIEQALDLADGGGIVLQSGECHTEVRIKPSDTFIRREITYTGSWYYTSEDYPAMLDLAAHGPRLDALCTHDVTADDAQAAIDDFLAGASGKVIVRWS
ncbi:zinc-dependent alcohol dehydrogenase [Jiangella alkaliphila]|uniref:Threonine dehydrogenase n=1 Tax=Jiangella alkaliphila TaxID=419479 RepID=A0A1H2K3Y0_9ACTN|nr:alcohol dehydrogenase catalytic domain-containing protein [Jiangella alkaliphila]SDU63420.1 Threonine dehydrogenase [Jiangella alkaliphila]